MPPSQSGASSDGWSASSSAVRNGLRAGSPSDGAAVVLWETYDMVAFGKVLASGPFNDDEVLSAPQRAAYRRLFGVASLLLPEKDGTGLAEDEHEIQRDEKAGVPVIYKPSADVIGGGRYRCHANVDVAKASACVDRRPDATRPEALPVYCHMKRQIRAHLAGGAHWDVDMVNCQPTLLEQVLKRHGISCPQLSRYVREREQCLDEVSAACGVPRDAAKNLFLRLTYLGGVRQWKEDFGVAEGRSPPQWVDDFALQLAAAARLLMDQVPAPREGVANASSASNASGQAATPQQKQQLLASALALHMQGHERKCLDALRDAVERDGLRVAALIHDGLLVAKRSAEEPPPSAEVLRSWCAHIACMAGFDVRVSVKRFEPDASWLEPAREPAGALALLPPYAEMKQQWERSVFKVRSSAEFMKLAHPDASAGAACESSPPRSFTRTKLLEAYEDLQYSVARCDKAKGAVAVATEPFVRRWLADPEMRAYERADTYPPPMAPPPEVFNLWDGFAVQRYRTVGLDGGDHGSAQVHPGVQALIGHVHMLVGATADGATDYVLDWLAQIFQEPGVKRGIALLLVGREGAGKNRLTDLLKLMVGEDKFLETANPGSVLYGRFTEPRRGKLVVVINEATAKDNHASNDLLKDMITSSSFVCEAKGRDAVTQRCYDRFMFCTNNVNVLRINPDSRRYVVFEVSSERVGDTQYFRELSAHIDDADTRRLFYKLLMARDLSGRDWMNDRPMTAQYRQMVQLNLPREYEFLRDEVLLKAYHEIGAQARGATVRVQSSRLFEMFVRYLDRERSAAAGGGSTYSASQKMFGMRMTALCEGKGEAMAGCSKRAASDGQNYIYEVEVACAAMVQRMWVDSDALVRGAATG